MAISIATPLALRATAELELRSRLSQVINQPENSQTQFQKQYLNDPVAFAHDCIRWKEGEGPAVYQDEALSELITYHREGLRSPHGAGKTGLVGWTILWFGLVNDGWTDWKIPITASAWRQLTKFALPEVHKWARRLRWDIIGREPFNERTELTQLSLKLKTGEAFALASDNSALIEGAHASKMLYVFDESKEIPVATWDSAEGAFSAGECFWLAVSTPGEPVGRFYDIQSHKPGYEDWHTKHITLEDVIKAGRVSESWAESRKIQWGEQSAAYQNRVKGEFASSEADGVIPLSWIEAANKRWDEWNDARKEAAKNGEEFQMPPFVGVGADIARMGEDSTCLALRYGMIISEIRATHLEDLMQTTGRIKGILDAHGGKAFVDVIGIGSGVVDRLREMKDKNDRKYNVVAFNASEHTDFMDKAKEMGFINCRSGAWWHLRELLEPSSDSGIALPPDDMLIGDLVAPHWKVVSGGKIQVEAKDDIKERIGRSTDYGDAVVMAFFDNNVLSLQNWTVALKKHTK